MKTLLALTMAWVAVGTPAAAEGPAIKKGRHKPLEALAPDYRPAVLRQPMKLAVQDKPLHLVLDDIAKQSGVHIDIDEQALTDAAMPLDSPVTARLSHVSLDALMRLMLDDMGLTYVWQENAMLVTTPTVRDAVRRARVFPVADLVSQPAAGESEPGPPIADFDTLADLLQTHVAPDAWPVGAGPGPFMPLGRTLVARLGEPLHDGVQQMLQALRAANRAEMDRPVLVGNDASWQILRERPRATFDRIATGQALDDLASTYQAGFLWDRRAMEDAVVIPPDAFTMRQAPNLYRSLQRMLKPHGFQVGLRHETIQMLPAAAAAVHHTCIFPVQDLVQSSQAKTGDLTITMDNMRETMHSLLRDPKDANPAVVDCVALPSRALLVVSGTLENIFEAERILEELRDAQK